ncbi:MAG: hypothetical protein OEW84_04795 [Aigarchaeota archaeon]|nr:hypothetical protein [Aigarchaeota archaeon]
MRRAMGEAEEESAEAAEEDRLARAGKRRKHRKRSRGPYRKAWLRVRS